MTSSRSCTTDKGARSDLRGREALVKDILRPPIAQEHLRLPPDDLVRIQLKRPFRDGTYAVDLDPLSLLSRLAAAVPPPRQHTLRYAGVLGAASNWRAPVVPPPPSAGVAATEPVEVPLKGQEASDPTVGRLLRCVTTGKIQLR